MAYVNATRFSQISLIQRVLAATSGITAALRQRQVYLATLRGTGTACRTAIWLDLGIHSFMLGDIAFEAADFTASGNS
ncbi:MAG: DUF1127 domain-containing protein [Cypionkella sp.]|nr:DUF1127 domain-containing protein [Cypionkella sp.]